MPFEKDCGEVCEIHAAIPSAVCIEIGEHAMHSYGCGCTVPNTPASRRADPIRCSACSMYVPRELFSVHYPRCSQEKAALGYVRPPEIAMPRTETADRLAKAAAATAEVAIEGRNKAERDLKVAHELIAKLQCDVAEARTETAALWYRLGGVLSLLDSKEQRPAEQQKIIALARGVHARFEPSE